MASEASELKGDGCAACGKALDPIRAGQVAVVEGAFLYFCNASCKSAYFSGSTETATAEPPAVEEKQVTSSTSAAASALVEARKPTSDGPSAAPQQPKARHAPWTEGTPRGAGADTSLSKPPAALAEPVEKVRRPSAVLSRAVLPTIVIVVAASFGAFAWALELLGPGSLRVRLLLGVIAAVVAPLGEIQARTFRLSRTRVVAALLPLCLVSVDVWSGKGWPNLGLAGLTAAASLTGLAFVSVATKGFSERTLDEFVRLTRHASSRPHQELRMVTEFGGVGVALVSIMIAMVGARPTVNLAVATALGAAAGLALHAVYLLFTAVLVSRLRPLEGKARVDDSLPRLAEIEQLLMPLRGVLIERESEVVDVVLESQAAVVSPLVSELAERLEHPCARELVRWARERSGKQAAPFHSRELGDFGGRGVSFGEGTQRVVLGTRALFVELGIGVARFEERARVHEDEATSVWFAAVDMHPVGFVVFRERLTPNARRAVRTLTLAGIEPVLVSDECSDFVERVATSVGIGVFRGDLPLHAVPAHLAELSAVESETALLVDGQTRGIFASVEGPLQIAISDSSTPAKGLVADDIGAASELVSSAKEMSSIFRRAFVALVVPASIVAVGVAFSVVPASIGPLAAALSTAVAFRWSQRLRLN